MKNKGFTLIELLIVITIIAVLAGAAVPFVQDYVQDARLARARSDLGAIASALARYELEEGLYTENNQSALTGRYISQILLDPWGEAYQINPDASVVYSSGGGIATVAVSFRPPLAPTRAFWIDKDQSGAMSAGDEIRIRFTRPLEAGVISESNLRAVGDFLINDDSAVAGDFGHSGNVPAEIDDDDGRLLIITLGADPKINLGDEISATDAVKDAAEDPWTQQKANATASVILRSFP